jgi:hypothetical protein
VALTHCKNDNNMVFNNIILLKIIICRINIINKNDDNIILYNNSNQSFIFKYYWC